MDYNSVPETLRRLNFLAFDDDARFEDGVTRLAEALRSDIDWIRKHTAFGEAAHRWSPDGRAGPHGLLLRSPLLEEAERWIASRPHGAPVPTATTQAFIAASRRETTRRRNILSASLAAGLVLSLGLAGLAYWQRGIANEQRQIATTEATRAERNFGAAKSTIDAVIFDLAQGLKTSKACEPKPPAGSSSRPGAPSANSRNRTNNDRSAPQQAHMFILFSETYASLGDTQLALDYAHKAVDILRALAAEDSDNLERGRDLSLGLDRVGAVLKDRGDLAGALAAYRESLDIRRELDARGSNAQRRHDQFVSLTAIGEVLYADGDIEGALTAFSQAIEIVRALVAEDPANTQWQRELSANFGKIGDVLKDQGDLARVLLSSPVPRHRPRTGRGRPGQHGMAARSVSKPDQCWKRLERTGRPRRYLRRLSEASTSRGRCRQGSGNGVARGVSVNPEQCRRRAPGARRHRRRARGLSRGARHRTHAGGEGSATRWRQV